MRAKVVISDGFNISPVIETDSKDLEERLTRIAETESSVSAAATSFVLQTFAGGYSVNLYNSPEGRSYGGSISMMERPEFWPGGPTAEQAGVFMLWIPIGNLSYWGGKGLDGCEPFAPGMPQMVELKSEDSDL